LHAHEHFALAFIAKISTATGASEGAHLLAASQQYLPE
jgi:hypothetical protein